MGIEDKWDIASVVEGKFLKGPTDCRPVKKDSSSLDNYFTWCRYSLTNHILAHFSNFEINKSTLMRLPCCMGVCVSSVSTSECLHQSV
jgi:hypothetical protein